jgi:hypothetical protein
MNWKAELDSRLHICKFLVGDVANVGEATAYQTRQAILYFVCCPLLNIVISVCMPTCLSACLSVCMPSLSVNLSVCMYVCLSVCRYVCLYMSVCLCLYFLTVCISVCPFCLSACLSVYLHAIDRPGIQGCWARPELIRRSWISVMHTASRSVQYTVWETDFVQFYICRSK